MKSAIQTLIEQIIEEELEDLEEQNAIAGMGVSATSTGGALSAAEKKHKDETGNGTRHDLLWAGDEVTSDKKSVVQERHAEVPQGGSPTEQLLISALSQAKYAGESDITLDDLVASNRGLRSANRVELRKILDKLSTQGMVGYTFSLECNGKTIWSGTFTDYSKLSDIKLAFLKRKCGSGSKLGIVDNIKLG